MIFDLDEHVLDCSAAGVTLNIPVSRVERIVEEQAVITLPFAASGLVGLLPVDDSLVPLYDLDSMSRNTRPEPQRDGFALVAVLMDFAERMAIRVDRVQGLPPRAQALAEAESSVQALPNILRDCVDTAVQRQDQMAFVFSPPRFARILREMASS